MKVFTKSAKQPNISLVISIMLLFLVLSTAFLRTLSSVDSSGNNAFPINIINHYCSPLYFSPLDTASSFYDIINKKCPRIASPHGISIVVNGKIILNAVNDHRAICDFGISKEMNDIQIIQKPDIAALLEMISDISNADNIPWFDQAMHRISDMSSNRWRSVCDLDDRLHCDANGHLIVIDLSHLNLSGTVHLQSLPQSVKTVDLSSNDLLTLNFADLRGKSLERLNVEHNHRFQVNTDRNVQVPESEEHRLWRTLQLSSNQIHPTMTDSRAKRFRIQNWLYRQQNFDELVFNGKRIPRTEYAPFYEAMLKVVVGVTNKEVIPWYQSFMDEKTIPFYEWQNYRVVHSTGHQRSRFRKRFSFDLSGLGLQGHIDLGSVSRYVMNLDLSNNNLSSISFVGNGSYNLRELNLQHNEHLRIDLGKLGKSTQLVGHLNRLLISSNQLVASGSATSLSPEIAVRKWLNRTRLNEVILDEIVMVRNSVYHHHKQRNAPALQRCNGGRRSP